MKQENLDTFCKVHELHRYITERAVALEEEVKRTGDLEELADLGYVLRETTSMLHDCELQLKRVQELCAKIFTALWALSQDGPDRIETEWCSATPNPVTRARELKMKTDPDRYRSVMAELGLPQELIETGLFRLGYDELASTLTEMAKRGQRLPSGLDQTWTEHRLNIRSKRKLASVLSGARQERSPGEEDASDVERLDESPF